MQEVFPAGVVIYFRAMSPDGTIPRSIHLKGRYVRIDCRDGAHPDDYVVFDAEDLPLGFYPREFVSAILPLDTVGPANASNSPKAT